MGLGRSISPPRVRGGEMRLNGLDLGKVGARHADHGCLYSGVGREPCKA